MSRPSKREISHLYNSLICVVKALEGRYTTIDLRNEACVRGKIINVDGYMNVDMKNATYFDPRGKEYCFDTFFVQARNIVYVHIPDGTTANELIEEYMNSIRIHRHRPVVKPHNFKMKRALRYQEETLNFLKQKSFPTTNQKNHL